MLEAYTCSDHRTWDTHVAFALNTAMRETTVLEPAVLMFGRNLRTQLTNKLVTEILNVPLADSQEIYIKANQHKEQVLKIRKQVLL